MQKLISLLLPTIFFLSACSGSDEPDSAAANGGAPPPQAVKAVIAETSALDHTIEATGTILANESVELRSETSGRIVGVYFKEGDPVQTGALLLKIDDRELQAQRTKTQLSIDLAEEDVQRKKKLLDVGGISQEEFDAAQNNLLKLEADDQLLAAQIDKTRITAPFNGTVGLRYVSEGGYVSASTRIADMHQTVPVKLEFTVSEKYAPYMQNGVQVSFTVEGNNRTYTATVYAKEPMIDPSTRTLKVRAVAPNADRTLLPGAFAKLFINLGTVADAIVLPAEAVIPAITGQTVMVVRNGVATVQPVKTGIRSGTTTQITEGIVPGDTIITSGLLTVRPGMPVKPVLVNTQVKKD